MEKEILNLLQELNPYVPIDFKTKLLEEEILDSMVLLLLISELEEKYNIEIPLENLQLECFENVSSIVKLVQSLV